jgi:hypothetical protein
MGRKRRIDSGLEGKHGRTMSCWLNNGLRGLRFARARGSRRGCVAAQRKCALLENHPHLNKINTKIPAFLFFLKPKHKSYPQTYPTTPAPHKEQHDPKLQGSVLASPVQRSSKPAQPCTRNRDPAPTACLPWMRLAFRYCPWRV